MDTHRIDGQDERPVKGAVASIVISGQGYDVHIVGQIKRDSRSPTVPDFNKNQSVVIRRTLKPCDH
jgi:hypothetical protein